MTDLRRVPDRAAPECDAGAAASQFAADVQYYLVQDPRQLPSRYLYDDLGSALFEAICRLPWYGITRAEERLLVRHGSDVFRLAAPVTTIVELGPGNGEKIRMLIEAGGAAAPRVQVHLVDVSSSALESAGRMLARLEHVHLSTHQAGYEAGLREVAAERASGDRMLLLFLGSNIGNFDPPGTNAFLSAVRRELAAGDWLLMGADLVKPEPDLLLAYDDPLGVTAAFNRNLLVRINRELRGTFDIDQFVHRAVWAANDSRVEMHLVARRAMEIRIEAAGLELAMRRDEPIWTESSYKYRPEEVTGLLERAGFQPVAQWLDHADQFALSLVQAA
jgi:dimethylhistidine N-methyltransferase